MMDDNQNDSDLLYGKLNFDETRSVSKPGTTSKRVKLWLVILSILVIFSVVAMGIITGVIAMQTKYIGMQQQTSSCGNYSQLQKYESNFEDLLADIQEMKNTAENQKADFEKRVFILQKTLVLLRNESEKEKDMTKRKYEAIKQDVENKKNETDTVVQMMAEQIKTLNTTVAFSAYYDKGYIYSSNGQVIKFNQVTTNIGNHYSATSGKFRCPVRGVYGFWFNFYTRGLVKGGKDFSWAAIALDSLLLTRAYCNNQNTGSIAIMCGANAVTVCDQGSEVWVQSLLRGARGQLFGDSDRESTFSGFLIQRL